MTDRDDPESALLAAMLSRLPNRVVLDVGAGKGRFVDLSLAAGSTRAFAFEPYPPHAAELQRRFAGVDAVTVLDVALGAVDAPVSLHVARDGAGRPLDDHHSIVKHPDRHDVRWPSALGVRCRTLDSLAADGSIPRSVGLLNINTGGGDLLVVRGAASIDSGVLAVECEDASEVVPLLNARGYRDFVLVKRHDEFALLQVGSARLREGERGTLVFVHESVREDLMPVVAETSAAAAQRLMDRVVTAEREYRERLAVIDALQDALSRAERANPLVPDGIEVSADTRMPWVRPVPTGEVDRLRARTPTVSVITPSYNQAAFLEQALRSVLEQRYPHVEYIVIDGGSTDGSVEILRRYADRLAFWVSEPDRGQAHAVNKGMARATGDIVAWLNSDDFYYPGAIQAAVDAFAENPTLAFVYGQGNRVDERGDLIERFAFTRPFDLGALTAGIDYILQPTVFMRRGALSQVAPLDVTLRWALDWDLWIRLGRKLPAQMIDQIVAASREHKSTKTSSGGLNRIEEIRRVVRRHTGRDVSVGYLNYLMYALLDALPESRIPQQARLEGGIHEVAAACGELLRNDELQSEPGGARRLMRALVPPRARRAILRFLMGALR